MKETSIFVGIATVAVVVGVFVFLFGREGAQRPVVVVEQSTTQSVAEVPFTEILRGSQSEVTRRVNYLITSPSELSALWKIVNAPIPPPEVDFTTKAVVAVFAGKTLAASSGIAVARIEDSNARMVSIALALPEDSCESKKATTSAPYQIIVMPATALPLAHTDQVMQIGCP